VSVKRAHSTLQTVVQPTLIFHAGRRSVVWPPAPSFSWSRLTAPVSYQRGVPLWTVS